MNETGVICPHCGSGLSSVTDTRKIAGGIRRRRRCFKCSRIFVTEETARLAPLEDA